MCDRWVLFFVVVFGLLCFHAKFELVKNSKSETMLSLKKAPTDRMSCWYSYSKCGPGDCKTTVMFTADGPGVHASCLSAEFWQAAACTDGIFEVGQPVRDHAIIFVTQFLHTCTVFGGSRVVLSPYTVCCLVGKACCKSVCKIRTVSAVLSKSCS